MLSTQDKLQRNNQSDVAMKQLPDTQAENCAEKEADNHPRQN